MVKFGLFPALKLLIAVVLVSFTSTAKAETLIITSGGGASEPTITIDEPISFTIDATGDGGVAGIVFQDVWSSPPNYNFDAADLALSTATLKNDTTTDSVGFTADWKTGGVNIGAITSDDSYIVLESGANFALSTSPGNEVTLSAGNFVTQVDSNFQVFPGGTYQVFLVDGNGTQISTDGIAAVPEPSTWALMLGGLGLLASRRIRHRRVIS